MKCEKCSASLKYGAKYCTLCGEKISSETLEKEYKHTLWGKLQTAEDWYSKLSLKKFTGNIFVKIIVLAAILAYGGYQLWIGGSDIKILAADDYKVAYNETLDEFYIQTEKNETNLNLYIPPFTDEVKITGYADDGSVIETRTLKSTEYKEEDAFKIVKNEFSYTVISIKRDNMKLYITD